MNKIEIDYLTEICKGRRLDEITKLMNDKFGTTYTECAIRNKMYRSKLKSGYKRFMVNNKELLQFITDNYESMPLKQLAEKFNEKYGTNFSTESIRAFKYRYKLPVKGKITTVKKGSIGLNRKPVGSEWRKTTNNQIYIKVKQPDVWMLKKRYIYEQVYGELPEGYDIIFLNGDKTDFRLENLKAIKRKDLLIAKNNHLLFEDSELTNTGLLIAEVINKNAEIKKDKKIFKN